MNVPLWKFNPVQVLALACFGVAVGVWLKKKVPVLDRLNIPASVVGGLVYALAALALRDRLLNLEFDLVLRDIFMVAFFTTIGMSASLRLVKQGGQRLLLYFGLATLGIALENVLGVVAARVMGLDPLIGLIAGSVTMAGGPATALAFGGTFESLGVTAGTTLAIACAIAGIVAGGLLGGFAGGWLIRRRGLHTAGGPRVSAEAAVEAVAYAADPPPTVASPVAEEAAREHASLLNNVVALGVAMGLGTLVSRALQNLGLVLPAYIGAMLCAAFIRNLDDRFRFAGISQRQMDMVGNISLNLFIVMALLTLQLWELVHLAVPVLVILFLQVVLVMLLCMTLTFRLMGRDYDAAVMSGGYCGFMLGTTANAMACMDELVQKFGPAPQAFLIVSLVGAFLIDFTNALIITNAINLLR